MLAGLEPDAGAKEDELAGMMDSELIVAPMAPAAELLEAGIAGDAAGAEIG